MDGDRFDDLSRRLARGLTRRAALRGAAAGLLAAVGVRAGATAQVSQAQCGNVTCRTNPGKCAPGCVCCDYGNGNSRCRPPGACGPGTTLCPPDRPTLDPVRGCVVPATTTPAPTTTLPPATTTLPPATTTAAPATTTLPPATTTLPPTTTTLTPATTTLSPATTTPPPITTTLPPATTTTTTTPPPQTGRALGTACSAASQCASGFCTDGVCCTDSSCASNCRRCNVAGSLGTCSNSCPGETDCTSRGFCSGRDGGICGNPMPKADGTACGDFSANACLADQGACQSGVCQPVPAVTCPAGSQCQDSVCNPETGLCVLVSKANGTPCEGGNLCTEDFCRAGFCFQGANRTCELLDGCHDRGVCDPATGVCSNPNRPDGTECTNDSGDTADCNSCQAGVCIPKSDGTGCGAGGRCNSCSRGQCSSIFPVTGSTCPSLDDADCCLAGYCAVGFCASCKGPDASCSRDRECCSGDCGVLFRCIG